MHPAETYFARVKEGKCLLEIICILHMFFLFCVCACVNTVIFLCNEIFKIVFIFKATWYHVCNL